MRANVEMVDRDARKLTLLGFACRDVELQCDNSRRRHGRDALAAMDGNQWVSDFRADTVILQLRGQSSRDAKKRCGVGQRYNRAK